MKFPNEIEMVASELEKTIPYYKVSLSQTTSHSSLIAGHSNRLISLFIILTKRNLMPFVQFTSDSIQSEANFLSDLYNVRELSKAPNYSILSFI